MICCQKKESQPPHGVLALRKNCRWSCLAHSAQATRTYIDASVALADLNNNPLNVRQPAAPGVPLRVAHGVAELGSFSANITSYWHPEFPLSHIDRALKKSNDNTTRRHFVQVSPVRLVGKERMHD